MYQPFLRTYYTEKVVPQLMKSQEYKNVHEVPCIEKIVINSGVNAEAEKAYITDLQKDMGLLAGQKPVITKAKKSISNFKLREGMPVGVMVTLRKNLMYEFLYRLTSVALPLIRDFRGLSSKMDGRGNYTFGVVDHTIFPEVHSESSSRKSIGFNVTLTTTAKTDAEARELLTLMGMPFRKAPKTELTVSQ